MNPHLLNLVFTFLSLCGMLAGGYFFDPVYFDFIPIPVMLFMGIAAWGSMNIQSNYHIKAICNGSRNENKIALTYDDGPSGENTERLLNVLKKENVPATFFLIGKNIEGKEQQVQRMIKDGHSIGNHSYLHNFWYDLNRKKFFLEDLNKNKKILEKFYSSPVQWVRPPYGVTTPSLADAMKEMGLQCIGWDVRSLDTKGGSVSDILERILQQVQNGSIILLHDHLDQAAEISEALIKALKEKKFNIVPLKELIHA